MYYACVYALCMCVCIMRACMYYSCMCASRTGTDGDQCGRLYVFFLWVPAYSDWHAVDVPAQVSLPTGGLAQRVHAAAVGRRRAATYHPPGGLRGRLLLLRLQVVRLLATFVFFLLSDSPSSIPRLSPLPVTHTCIHSRVPPTICIHTRPHAHIHTCARLLHRVDCIVVLIRRPAASRSASNSGQNTRGHRRRIRTRRLSWRVSQPYLNLSLRPSAVPAAVFRRVCECPVGIMIVSALLG